MSNTQRPTPETDAMFTSFNRREPNAIDPADFARKLERERDEARDQLESMREAIKEAHQALKMIHDVVNEQVANAVVIVPLGYAAAALAKLQPFLP